MRGEMHAIEAMPAFTPPSPVEGEGILWSPPHKISAEQYWARDQETLRQVREPAGAVGCPWRELFACGVRGFARIIRAKNRYWCGFPGNKAATLWSPRWRRHGVPSARDV